MQARLDWAVGYSDADRNLENFGDPEAEFTRFRITTNYSSQNCLIREFSLCYRRSTCSHYKLNVIYHNRIYVLKTIYLYTEDFILTKVGKLPTYPRMHDVIFTIHQWCKYQSTLDRTETDYLSFIYPTRGRFDEIFTQSGDISRGRSPREISILRVNISSSLPSGGYANYILYRNSIYT